MRLESKKLLFDMQLAAQRIATFTRDRSEQQYLADVMLRSAVERQFEIVGEALSQLRKSDPATTTRITDHHSIIGFRNVLIHGYRTVSDVITWRIVQEHLSTLLRDLDTLLAEPETDD